MKVLYWLWNYKKVVGIGLATVGVLGYLAVLRQGYIELGAQRCQANVERAIEQQRTIDLQNAEIFEAYRASSESAKPKGSEVNDHVPDLPECRIDDVGYRMLNDALSGAAFRPDYPSESGD